MAYNEELATSVREILSSRDDVEEKKMMGGLTFMVNKKMCVGIIKDDLMLRIDPDNHEDTIKIPGCRTMDFTNREPKGFVFVDSETIKTTDELQGWINLALDFNKKAKASKKKKKVIKKK